MNFKKRICGMFFFCMGLGMLIGVVAKGIAFLIAAVLLILGFWLLFM